MCVVVGRCSAALLPVGIHSLSHLYPRTVLPHCRCPALLNCLAAAVVLCCLATADRSAASPVFFLAAPALVKKPPQFAYLKMLIKY